MTPVTVRSNDIVCLKAIIPQRPYRQQMYIQQRHKRTAEASARWLIDQSHKGVRNRPWSYSVMTNTLCCWLCRILCDLSVHLLTHCPSHAPLTSSPSYCLSFFPPPPDTCVDQITVSDLGYLRRNLKLQSKPSLSLSLNQDNFTHVTQWGSLTYLLESHTEVCMWFQQIS